MISETQKKVNKLLTAFDDLERVNNKLNEKVKAFRNNKPIMINNQEEGILEMKYLDPKDSKKNSKEERKKQNDKVLQSYGLLKNKQQVIKVPYAPTYTQIFYVDFSSTETRGCYAKYKRER